MSAHYRKPVVRNTELRYLPDEKSSNWITIQIGSDEWFEWLESPANKGFHYTGSVADFSARKERRRNGYFWYGYRKIYGKLHKKYIGKAEMLTPSTLEETSLHLATTYEKSISE